MQKLTVKKINWKEGEGAKGKWTKIGIITEELGDKWLGCFEDKYNSAKLRAIAEGSVIEIVVTQNGDFWNFSFPTKADVANQEIAELRERIVRLEKHCFPAMVPNTSVPYPEETDVNGADDF